MKPEQLWDSVLRSNISDSDVLLSSIQSANSTTFRTIDKKRHSAPERISAGSHNSSSIFRTGGNDVHSVSFMTPRRTREFADTLR